MIRNKRAVFLDRDGTINEDLDYVIDPSHFKLLDKVLDGMRLLQQNYFKIIVISNQSGVSRGYFTIHQVDNFHRKMRDELKKGGIEVDGIYFCPHYKNGKVKEYAIDCLCRKPNPGLILQAANDFQLDLKRCFMVGDKILDVEAGIKAGCKSILVLTGKGKEELKNRKAWEIHPHYITRDLLDAAYWIIKTSYNQDV
ncbi:MAG: D-glycero-beta-D-manno-heptose 1,7-bisphosphate 7-phosphatase [bacterium]|nr:D-glycero-beta-D-manno-heptose 1,7-bisphosphate 7-phosphatase [bacterium]